MGEGFGPSPEEMGIEPEIDETEDDTQSAVQAESLQVPKTPVKKGFWRKILARRGDLESQAGLEFERGSSGLEAALKMLEVMPQVENCRNRTACLADREKIENQEIDIIDLKDQGKIQILFKLTEDHFENVLKKFQVEEIDEIRYKAKDRPEDAYNVPARRIDINQNVQVKVANTTRQHGGRQSFLGLVSIEIQLSGTRTSEVEPQVAQILRQALEIPEGLKKPDKEAEDKYKIARYLWHHKLKKVSASEEAEVCQRLERREVFPNYHTMVDPGRHKEYEKISPFACLHYISDHGNVPSIIRAGGLMSTHERYRRGMIVNGMSSTQDLNTGGADSVFTRIITEKGIGRNTFSSVAFVFRPELLDRTDWYAYLSDNYGSIIPDTFLSRRSPKELLEYQASSGNDASDSNEQMFRLGISTEDIQAIVCPLFSESYRYFYNVCRDKTGISDDEFREIWTQNAEAVLDYCQKNEIDSIYGVPVDTYLYGDPAFGILQKLTEAGITEINGKPVAEFIVRVQTQQEVIDTANGRPPRQKVESSSVSTPETEEGLNKVYMPPSE